MARPLRDKDPASFQFITLRTEESRLWMTPSRNVEKIIGGVVARYQEIFGIELYGFCFLSNHYHLALRAPRGNVDEFEENVNREIARRLNWKHQRQGKFWGRRYDSQKILSEADLLKAFLYINCNPVHHGLEENPARWTGLSSLQQVLTESERTFTFYHYSATGDEEKVTRHTLKLTPLPQFAGLSKQERIQKIKTLIQEHTANLITKRKIAGKGFLGIEQVLECAPGSIPQTTSRKVRPICYSDNHELKKQFRIILRARCAQYAEASRRFRLGDLNAIFPEHSFKPPLHRKPRSARFKVLPDDHFKIAA